MNTFLFKVILKILVLETFYSKIQIYYLVIFDLNLTQGHFHAIENKINVKFSIDDMIWVFFTEKISIKIVIFEDFDDH